MKKLVVSLVFIVLALEGCGGSGHHNKSPSPIPSSSSSSAIVVSSSSSSAVTSSSSKSSSSKVSSSSSVVSTSSSQAASSIPFTLESNSFVADGYIPNKYSCLDSQVSPHLKWSITSDAVKSFVMIMEDIDAIPIVYHPYVHWGIYNIPGSVREIAEGATLRAMPVGSFEALNDDDLVQYSGPCPPGTSTHHYYFTLYAINTESLGTDAAHTKIRRSDFEKRYASNIIQKVEIVGLFKN